MAFELSVPDPKETAKKVSQEMAVEPQVVEAIESTVSEKGNEIMSADLNSFEKRREIMTAIDNLGKDITKKSATKNEILSKRMVQLSREGSESGEIAKGLEDLSVKMRDLDPSGVDFAKAGPLGKLFNPVRRYFEKYKTADQQINSIIESLEKGKKTLESDNITLQIEEQYMRDLTVQLNQQIELAGDLDAYLSNAIEHAKADPSSDPDRIAFVEEEVLLPLRQKTLDFQQLLTVNQQGIVSMNIIRRNNLELIRAVDRAETVTVSALRVAVTVASALYNQKIVLEKIDSLNKTTNQMIASTSKMLKEQGTEIQKNAMEANINPDMLKEAFQDTIQALDDISTYKQQALPRIKQTIDQFQEIANEGQKYVDRIEEREMNYLEAKKSLTDKTQ